MKGITPLVILAVMYLYRAAPYRATENPAAWVYFGVHGCYGLLWVGKTLAGFGDQRWKARKSIFFMPNIVISLGLYWLPIVYICQQTQHDS